MALVNDLIPPAEATGYVRELPGPVELILNRYLPDRPIPNIDAAWTELERVNRAAKVRTYDAESTVGKRDTFERRSARMVPVDEKLPVGEEEELMLAAARTGGDETDALKLACYDDLDILTGRVHNRVELGRGSVLTTGKFELDENGLHGLVADFGVDNDQFVTTTTNWLTDPDAPALDELREIHDAYVDRSGGTAGFMIGERAILTALSRNNQVIETVGGTGSFVTAAQVRAALEQAELPLFQPYNTQIDVDGVAVRPIPTGTLVFVPPNPRDLGYTGWGIRVEALALTRGSDPDLVFEEAPGLIATVKREGDPHRTWTLVGATFLPVIEGPDKLTVIDVTGPAPSV